MLIPFLIEAALLAVGESYSRVRDLSTWEIHHKVPWALFGLSTRMFFENN
jgi:hypothetical protein